MSFNNVLNLLSGIALFLYGMSIMGSGLERLAGSKLEGILRSLTSSTWKAVLLGAGITAIIQSSTATTVIVVGLVNSGIMKLDQAVGVIMGANIGTTITAQILRMSDISSDNIFLQLLKPSTMAPVFAVVGAVLFVFLKSKKANDLGQILIGFGILFTGMFTMEAAVEPLHGSPLFLQLFATLTNPVLGVAVGAIVTIILQSSSATVGILQALASTGSITWSAAVPLILGQNIGTTLTSILSSIGATRNAKRSAAIHVYFNAIGTAIFLVLIYAVNSFIGLPFWADPITRTGIANFHTFFNVVATLMFLPFTKQLTKLTYLTIPVTAAEKEETALVLPVLDDRLLVSPSFAVQQAKSAVDTMGNYAKINFERSMKLLFDFQPDRVSRLVQVEDYLDKLEVTIDDYLVKITAQELSAGENFSVSQMFSMVTEFERIGDYSVNIMELAQQMREEDITFTPNAQFELRKLEEALNEIVSLSSESYMKTDTTIAGKVEPLEQTIDEMCDLLQKKHIYRLKNNLCSVDAGIIFLNILTNVERIADHCSNIAAYVLATDWEGAEAFDVHKMRQGLHEGKAEHYNMLFAEYNEKYLTDLINE